MFITQGFRHGLLCFSGIPLLSLCLSGSLGNSSICFPLLCSSLNFHAACPLPSFAHMAVSWLTSISQCLYLIRPVLFRYILGSVGKYPRRHNSFFSHLFFWSQLGNLDLQILLLQQSPPFLPPPVSPLTSPSKTGITGLVLLLSACGPMGMWSTTHEVGTALREKKGCCWPFEADLCLSAFLCWIISNCHKF